jgi:TolB-like protein/Flp pilus assembly protein TadD
MAHEFRLGEWLVEPDLNRIQCSHRSVAVEPKVLDVLVCLAERAGQVLSKDQIIRRVWPGTYVSEGILSYSISELRRALGDDARNPRFIETISRKGYRLIAPVTQLDAPPATKSSIAVLPFSDLSPEKDQEYFCAGIAEEIINHLTRVQSLRVAARTSCFAFKGKMEDVRAVGRKLGVDTVLEGSVRKAADRLRITAQLVNVADGCQLWSERFDRDPEDIFTIQDEIARSIASTLRITLSPGESSAIGRMPTPDIRAYDYYLRGKQFFNQYTRRGVIYALRMFLQAVALDPAYARAHAGIADCCSYLYRYAGGDPDHFLQADSASRNAVELSPWSAEAHASRGMALSLNGNYREAEREFQTAIRFNAGLWEAYYFYARNAFSHGEPEKAIELYQKAREIDPQDYQAPLLVAQIYDDLGMKEEAEAARRDGIVNVEERLLLHPEDARALYMGANGLVALGDVPRGLEWAAQALAADPEEPMILYNVACIRALAGQAEDALECLEKAVKTGLVEKGWIVNDSNLALLHDHPRYQAVLSSMPHGD